MFPFGRKGHVSAQSAQTASQRERLSRFCVVECFHTARQQWEVPTTDKKPRPQDPALWNALSDDRRDALEARYHTFRVQDEDFFRSDASLIRYSHRVAGPR